MPVDFEEIALQRFLVRNPMVRPLLKGEGELQGQWFTLTSWRRDGLMARIRQKGFTTLTLEDRLARLPGLPQPRHEGPPLSRAVARIDRYSRFDPHTLAWQAIPIEQSNGEQRVVLFEGQVVRVRAGRGAARFYSVRAEPGNRAALDALSETNALLLGYARAHQNDPPQLYAVREGEALLLPAIELPPPHRELMERLGTHQQDKWRVEQAAWPLARATYKRLGIVLRDKG